MEVRFKAGTRIQSHGGSYSGEPDSAGFYTGYDLYSIGPDGSAFRLGWRSRELRQPELWSLGIGGFEIRNRGSVPVEVTLHADTMAETISAGRFIRISLDAAEAMMTT